VDLSFQEVLALRVVLCTFFFNRVVFFRPFMVLGVCHRNKVSSPPSADATIFRNYLMADGRSKLSSVFVDEISGLNLGAMHLAWGEPTKFEEDPSGLFGY